MNERLCVVMPVYNEQDAIGPVLVKWSKALDALGIDYVIRPYNDGSKDNSLAVMRAATEHLSRVEVRDKKNGGHGNTILTGYRDAAADGFDWVFQIDSDDEMGPEKFSELWAKRGDYDFLVGIRDGRVQQLPRKIISFVSRLCVRIFYGKSIWDVNSPYRLMRVSSFGGFYQSIPLTTFAPNVILAGLAARNRLRCYEIRVPQHDRRTGEVSIKKWKLLKAAVKSFSQTILFSRNKCVSLLFDVLVGAVIVLGCLLSFGFLCAPMRFVCGMLCIILWRNKTVRSILYSLGDLINQHIGCALWSMLVVGVLLRVVFAVVFPHVVDQSCWWPKMDYLVLWEKAKEFAGGTFPISKSWVTVLAYGGVAKLAGPSLKIAFVASSVLNLLAVVFAFLTIRIWFGKFAGIVAASLMWLSPYLISHCANVATEHCYALFVWLCLYLFAKASASKHFRGRLVYGCAAGASAWLATWSRGEGVLLLPVVLGWLVVKEACVRNSLKRSLIVAGAFSVVFALGATFALKVNSTMSGAKTFFCSNDNVWPRLFGSNFEHRGQINGDDIEMICKRLGCDESALGDRASQQVTDYVEDEIRQRWRRMGMVKSSRLVVIKEWTDWCHDVVPFRAESMGGRCLAKLLSIPVPGLISVLAFSFFVVLMMEWLRGVDMSNVWDSLGIVGFVFGNVVILSLTEAQPRYGYLFCICWPAFAGAGFASCLKK